MDYYARVNVAPLAMTYAASPTVIFDPSSKEKMMDAQILQNVSAAEIIYVSWDGVNDHGLLDITGELVVMTRLRHKRRQVWLRRSAAGGGAQYVDVTAWTES